MNMKQDTMQYLKRAQDYAHARGDDNWFAQCYSLNRESFSVRDSVRFTVSWLYSDHVADMLEYYYG